MEVQPGQRVRERLRGVSPEIVSNAPIKENVLVFTPLGGMGEIGKNCSLLQFGGESILIDCGLRFPNAEEFPGIDLIVPDFTALRELPKPPLAVVLTHGHEDHIGALAFLLRDFELPIIGTRFTLALAKGRLEEHGVLGRCRLVEMEPGDKIALGPFHVGCFTVCHSTVDGVGLIIDTPLGLIVHSGDFKFDSDPVDGRKIDTTVLKALGDRGVLALISDSTNVENPGRTPGERSVRPALEKVFAGAKRRIITTSFASHVHRFQQVLEVAASVGRKVATLGRSMNGNMGLADELGLLKPPKGVWLDLNDVLRMDPAKTVLVSTGSQGEPRSGLARMADGTHTDVKVVEGDLLVYSARAIPGNERVIGNMINHFYRRGAQVVTQRQEKVHSSGHGAREDLAEMLALLRPRYLLPGHGEYRHQVVHRELAWELGLPQGAVYLLENGQRWTFDGHSARVDGRVSAGEILVDGLSVGEEWGLVLRDRRHLNEDGIVVAVLTLSRSNGEIIAGPEIMARGLLMKESQEQVLIEATQIVRQVLTERQREAGLDFEAAREIMTSTLKRFFKRRTQGRPVILPAVVEI